MPKKETVSVYRQIANELMDEIRRTMSVDDKLPPELELAKRFNVHVLTIRRALRLLQEGGVIQRQRALGTTVINPLAGNWVSIVCELDVFSPANQYLFERSVIFYLRDYLIDAGLPSRVSIGRYLPGSQSDSKLTSLDFLADVEAGRLAGVLALSVNPTEYWLQKLIKQDVPVVGTNTLFPSSVLLDHHEDMQKAMRYLMDYGSDRIAYIGWADKGAGDRVSMALDEMQKCYPGVLRKEWIKSDIHPLKPGSGWEEFREIWSSEGDKPNGLIVDNENLLPDVERALEEFGISVPEDLIVVCHRTRGNTLTPRFPVIFMELDPRLYAYRMADMFLKLYRSEDVPSKYSLVPRIFIDDAMREASGGASPVWAKQRH